MARHSKRPRLVLSETDRYRLRRLAGSRTAAKRESERGGHVQRRVAVRHRARGGEFPKASVDSGPASWPQPWPRLTAKIRVPGPCASPAGSRSPGARARSTSAGSICAWPPGRGCARAPGNRRCSCSDSSSILIFPRRVPTRRRSCSRAWGGRGPAPGTGLRPWRTCVPPSPTSSAVGMCAGWSRPP